MRRRPLLFFAILSVTIAIAAVAAQKPKTDGLLVLEWAAQSAAATPPTAILLELGAKDTAPVAWAGRASITGAKVVHREGYRFRGDDKLVEPDAWEASSHRPVRLPPRNPALAKTEGIATVGVVLHLSDVAEECSLTIETTGAERRKETVSLKSVFLGKPQPVLEGNGVVRLISTALPVAVGKTEDDFPAAAYGPDGTLWVSYVSYHVKEDGRRIESAQLREPPKDFRAFHTPEFGDQVFVRTYRAGQWSEPMALTDDRQDIVRCAVAVGQDGVAWVAYSAFREGKHDIYARPIRPGEKPGPEQRLTRTVASDEKVASFLNPVLCTRGSGVVQLGCQAWGRDGRAGLSLRTWHERDRSTSLMSGPSNHWSLTQAAGPGDTVAIAWDEYGASGDYDVGVLLPGTTSGVATSKFEARPSLCFDAQGRLWMAYEEGPELWGKDYGALDDKDGEPLYGSRSVRVVCLQKGKLFAPVAQLPMAENKKPSLPFGGQVGPTYERSTRYSNPQLGLDGKGRLWLTYRQKFGTRYSSHPGSYWLTFARRLDGDRWSEPIEVHHSDGLLDQRPVLLPHASGGLLLVHNSDGRYTTPDRIDNNISLSTINLPGDPVEPKLTAFVPAKKKGPLTARANQEAAAVKRMRDARIETGGKSLRFLRGEFHRHTEISWDGGPDGSLEDMFRYGIDAAGMDWIGNGDHDSGAGREYSWWLIQKFTDAYHVAERFTPMFTYERSVGYPHGHRNCMFARRGIRTLPRLAEPDMDKRVGGVHADDTKMLYRYLRELNGICAIHTSATSMGTDWRDNDPLVEPIVEIYQGDRMSYEHQAAPRAGYEANSGKEPVNVAGWYPLGFIDNAFKKGYRLGFQASSDHWSTHISYCIVLAERHDREAILEAIKKRHVYGATDDIVVDLRSGPHIQGDECRAAGPPKLDLHVVGTGPIARIDILRDSVVVESLRPAKAEYRGSWTDPRPLPGVHSYYIRVIQENGELAWASPLWIECPN